ncbi:hypothetical protein IMSAGC018_00526 [Lachnospiraceae bacterium]|nr:hypothetical protein IMSAGC018_00526 [Lachnospiraceae bacterium]
MKIYGDYTFILDKLNIWNNSQVKMFQNGTKIVEFADKFLEEQRAASPDRISISAEGLDYMRQKLSGLGSGGSDIHLTEGEPLSKFSDAGMSLMDGVCRGYILKRLDFKGTNGVSSRLYTDMEKRYQEELAGKSEKNVTTHAESLVDAYAAMYRNIVEEYENGTREVWTLDNSMGDDFSGVEFEINGQAVRYRKLTMEEELGRLKDSFNQLAEDVAKELAREDAAKKAMEDKEIDPDEEVDFWKMKDIVKDFMDELDRLITLLEQMFAKKEEEPENIGERIVAESKGHVAATVARGKQQAQFANYRKMTQMAVNVQSVLGNIRA